MRTEEQKARDVDCNRRRRARLSAEERRAYFRAAYARVKANPAQIAVRRARSRAYYNAANSTPEGTANYRQRARDYYQRNRLRFQLQYLIRHPTVKGNRMRSKQTEALRLLSAAIIEAIDAAGPAGAPSGLVYSGLMAQGCTLEQYEQITDGLERAGLIQRAGNLLTATDKGREFARSIK